MWNEYTIIGAALIVFCSIGLAWLEMNEPGELK